MRQRMATAGATGSAHGSKDRPQVEAGQGTRPSGNAGDPWSQKISGQHADPQRPVPAGRHDVARRPRKI